MAKFAFEKLDFACGGGYLFPFKVENFHTGDLRGGFTKCFEKDIFAENGIMMQVDESFVSTSAKNVIRGLHFQLNKPQAKLVTVLHGRVWDVMVDLRPNSATFKKWYAMELSEQNNCALYIPRGFAHGFASLEDETVMLYQCEGRYDRETDTGIRFDTPEIGIPWPVPEQDAIYSERDKQLMTFSQYMENPMCE